MKQKTFSVRIPIELCNALDKEGLKRFRRKNTRNQMVTLILAERYQPETPNADLAASAIIAVPRNGSNHTN